MLSEALLAQLIDIALQTGGDFVEVFTEQTDCTELSARGSQIENAVSGTDFGVGIRLIKDLSCFYGYANSSDPEVLKALAKQLSESLKGSRLDGQTQVLNPLLTAPSPHIFLNSPRTVAMQTKADLLRSAHFAATGFDKTIIQTDARYLDQDQHIQIANSNGLYATDRRVRTRVLFRAMAEFEGRMESGYSGPGALQGFEFYEGIDLNAHAIKAAQMAATMVKADYCPAGKFPVIIDNGFGGLIFHEACGHSLEGSAVSRGNSVFTGKLGQKIASDVVTLVDDGSIQNAWGSSGIDDEGTPTQKNMLIENGTLKNYMLDTLSAKRMGAVANGSSRRQSYRFAPTSRMSNTYIDSGAHQVADMFAATENGLFAKSLGAGSVNPTTGDFNFSVVEGYWIKNGKIEKPVRGATLVGNGAEILRQVDMVGNNLKLEQGYCYAASGAIFVSMGQPTLRIQSMTVGGRAGV